jgi:hypothetical protein
LSCCLALQQHRGKPQACMLRRAPEYRGTVRCANVVEE